MEPGLSMYKAKRRVRRLVEESDIPYTYICCNSIASWPYHDNTHPSEVLPPLDRFQIYGDGSVKGQMSICVPTIFILSNYIIFIFIYNTQFPILCRYPVVLVQYFEQGYRSPSRINALHVQVYQRFLSLLLLGKH